MSLRVVCPEGHPVLIAESKIGAGATCPVCFSSFVADLPSGAPLHARKDQGKARRSRDDDDDEDDDDDDERPRKKVKKKTDDDEDEDERPKKKRKPVSDDDDDDDDRDDDEEDEDEEEKPKKKSAQKKKGKDDEEEEEEIEIEWTPRKRQLKICNNGVMAAIVSAYMLAGYGVFFALGWAFIKMLSPEIGSMMITYLSIPLMYLSLLAVVAAVCMNFAAPAKVEGKAAIISSLVFAGLMLLQAVLMILNYNELLVESTRVERFNELLAGGTVLSFIVSTISAMGYFSKLLFFMNLRLEASAPITNLGFIFLCYAGMAGLIYVTPLIERNIGDWVGYIIALVILVVCAVAMRMFYFHIRLLMLLREKIDKYIVEA